MIQQFLDLLAGEPVVVIGGTTGIVDAIIAAVIGFGFHLPPMTAGLVDGVIIAVLTFVGLLYARSKVTPNVKVAPVDQKIVVDVPAPVVPPVGG
jgi:hypothetical protein